MNDARKPFLLFLAIVLASCSSCTEQANQSAAQDQAGMDTLPRPAYETALPEELRPLIGRNFTGDLDGMIQRRMIRAGVTFNRTFYFIDKGVQRGLSYEYLMLFDEQLNKQLNSANAKVHVILLPMSRDALLPALRAGKIDLAVAQLTVTPERQNLVDFSDPTRAHVDEVVVTGPGSPAIGSLDDLSGKKVFVRKSSSYFASLEEHNRQLRSVGRPPIAIETVSESLEDDDLLEMVNAGLIPATVVDNYLADFWKQVFTNLTVHSGLALRSDGHLAVAVRKNSPKLASELNAFIAKFGLDSVMGRILSKRYLQSTTFVKNATSEAERQKFLAMIDLFRKYSGQYDLDFLLMAAQGYQESRLDQNAASPVGAIGVMQLMPATGKEQNVGDVHLLEPNIHAGVKYMRFMRDQYFQGEPMDDLNKGLFTFASYNAGPGRIRQLRREAAERGLDPNLWFGNVEQVASERIGRETVTYVSNIYKYYIAYGLVVAERQRRAAAKLDFAGRGR